MPLANLIIAGVNKAGTTSLFTYLSQHPDVGASRIKETCHFLPLRYGQRCSPLDAYERSFEGTGGSLFRVEATPGYFYGGRTLAHAIRSALPDARIVICLREPVARLVSFFRSQKAMLALPPEISLQQYVERCTSLTASELAKRETNPWFGLAGGTYANHLEQWFDVFGRDLRIEFFEELEADPAGLMRGLCAWLELEPDPYDGLTLGIENRTQAFRSRWVHRLALGINDAGEPFWRRHSGLKRALRRAYRAVNATEERVGVPPELSRWLSDYYAVSNARVARCLGERGIRLPDWLADAVP